MLICCNRVTENGKGRRGASTGDVENLRFLDSIATQSNNDLSPLCRAKASVSRSRRRYRNFIQEVLASSTSQCDARDQLSCGKKSWFILWITLGATFCNITLNATALVSVV